MAERNAAPPSAPAERDSGLKTYRAETMAHALTEVKRSLGPDAVILRTRTLKVGGVLGVGARSVVEITASADPAVAAIAAPKPARRREREQAESPAPVLPAVKPKPAVVSARNATARAEPVPAGDQGAGAAVRQLEGEMRALRSMMAEVVEASRRGSGVQSRAVASSPAAVDAPVGPVASLLAASGLPSGVIAEIASRAEGELSEAECADPEIVRATTRRLLADLVSIGGAIDRDGVAGTNGPRVIVMVGPTGVGKTTTIAKLAAFLKLQRGLRVGLITADTYRIAAVEQLRTYAGIIGLPLRVVLGPEELAAARAALSDCDVVLVDTAGRSPRDEAKLAELRAMVEAARPDEVHLVLSGAMGEGAARRAAERFGLVCDDRERLRVIVSKVDEADELGAVLGVVCSLGAAVSYLTTGQEVPDDFEAATGTGIADALLALDDRAIELGAHA